jgi:fumarate hydratase class II
MRRPQPSSIMPGKVNPTQCGLNRAQIDAYVDKSPHVDPAVMAGEPQ